MIDRLLDLYNNSPCTFTQKLKSNANKDLYDWFLIETDDIEEDSIKGKAFVLLFKPDLSCPYGNAKKFSQGRIRMCDRAGKCRCHSEKLAETGRSNPFWETEKERELFIADRKVSYREKYGVDNPSQRHIPIDVMDKYNDDEWMILQAKEKSSKQISIELGIARTTISKRMQTLGVSTKQVGSTFESEIGDFVKFHTPCQMNSRAITPPYEIDIYLPAYSMAIECNGTYWHSDLRGKDRHYHLNKTKLCEDQGIQLIHIWEHDWIKSPELIKRRLLSKLGKNERIFARKTQISTITTQTAAEFLNQHHIQGTCPASVKYGLYEGEGLVAVMTLGKSRFSKKYEWELLRYCSIKQVIGGASKLFSHFKKEYQPKSVVSYSDKMWNTGDLYKRLGFSYSHKINPRYYYTRDYKTFQNRVAYRKHKLHKKLEQFDSNLTEWENMQANGFDRIWDCGSDVWVWEK